MKPVKTMLFYTLMAVTILMSVTPVMAQEDLEREYLALLANEIDALEAILHKAELNQDKDARVKFQYDWLRSDLTQMKQGVLAHINAPRNQPRKVAPLKGEYRQ